ncbi:elicitor-responsive protein 1 [Daucus carota subsp. sativus]|uniref:elicitor-responsive protein 1 n=1 Tax=Daucus carota subsp. sativus TaxID=79200 RepID=UPI0007EF6665|nr:PREDICTED: elicitor-responsive protein 1-like [Daucus carota subsp. sativus]
MASGILEVTLVEAEELNEKNLWCCFCCFKPCVNHTTPYVELEYGGQKHRSCLAQEENKKQVWDEKFKFKVDYEGEEDNTNTKLILRIMDKNRISSDKLIGETTIYVKDILLCGMDEENVKGIVDVETQKHRVVRRDKSYSGEISVALTFTKAMSEKKTHMALAQLLARSPLYQNHAFSKEVLQE